MDSTTTNVHESALINGSTLWSSMPINCQDINIKSSYADNKLDIQWLKI